MKILPYNRKINAPIRFLYYLEVVDLFILLVVGVFLPLTISSFLPVNIPLWHMALWFVSVFFVITTVKTGRAPGFLHHWFAQLRIPRYMRPGKSPYPWFRAQRIEQLVEFQEDLTDAELTEIRRHIDQHQMQMQTQALRVMRDK